MKCRIFPHPLSGEIAAVPSKSYAHRYLIAAALSGGSVYYGDSEDAGLTAQALAALGFEAKFADNSVHYGTFHRPIDEVKVNVGESGSTLRFLLPLAAALGVKAEFLTAGRLSERPMEALTRALSSHGVSCSAQSVKGKLVAGRYEIDATISSQYVTGLLMALPLLEGESEIVLLGRAVSAPYIEITLEVLAAAGIEIERRETGYFIPGRKRYLPIESCIPGDFSGAAFPLVSGALGGAVTVSGLDLSSKQGDKAIVDVLRSVGADVVVSGNAITVRKDRLEGFIADVGETPDLAPVLAVLASYATGKSVLRRVSRLRAKESDRLLAIREMLTAAGIETGEGADELIIVGGQPHGGRFMTFADHRMAMAEAVLAAYSTGESEIDDMTCVKKSYPSFWRDYSALGGEYEVER